jgi:hypothetical protein
MADTHHVTMVLVDVIWVLHSTWYRKNPDWLRHDLPIVYKLAMGGSRRNLKYAYRCISTCKSENDPMLKADPSILRLVWNGRKCIPRRVIDSMQFHDTVGLINVWLSSVKRFFVELSP